jgi:two-component system LytT family response regulator
VRIHRSVIVNSARIAELQARSRGDYDVVLRSGACLELRRSYRARLQAVLGDF